MKEMNALLEYLRYFHYDPETETVYIIFEKDSEKAKVLYDNALTTLKDDENSRWYFDIALDCLRQFDEKYLNDFISEKEIRGYHFGTGLYVRNNYIYESRSHQHGTADDASAQVYKFMKGIVIPDFDPFEDK